MKTGTRESVSYALRFYLLRRDDYSCQYCGARAPDTALHIDHIVPVYDGGTNEPDNLMVSCFRCNLGKGKSSASDARARPETLREKKLRYKVAELERCRDWPHWVSCQPIRGIEVKAVLYVLAVWADQAAMFSISREHLAYATSLSEVEAARIMDGLEATGMVARHEAEDSLMMLDGEQVIYTGEININWDWQRGGKLKPPYALDDYNVHQLSDVSRVH